MDCPREPVDSRHSEAHDLTVLVPALSRTILGQVRASEPIQVPTQDDLSHDRLGRRRWFWGSASSNEEDGNTQ